MEITKDDFIEWKRDAVTKDVFKMLKERQDRYAEIKVGDVLVADNPFATQTILAQLSGKIEEIEDLLELNYEDLLTE